MKRLATTWAFIVIAVSVSMQAESLTASRTITENLVVYAPQTPCGVPVNALSISQITAIPAGIEFLPGCYQSEPRRPRDAEEISFFGLTAEEALDRLVAMDPRYRWVETDGVILVRPLQAWQDAHHFMNATISSFGFDDLNIGGAVSMLLQALRGFPVTVPSLAIPLRTEQGNRPFSVKGRTTSILEAANAVVRAHGSSYWTLGYCKPEQRIETATFMAYTFDRSGLGGGPPVFRDQNGRPYNACHPMGRR